MKRVLVYVCAVFLLVGCSEVTTKENESNWMFDEDGTPTAEHVELMQSEWCSHNEGQEFAEEQCEQSE